MGRVAGVIRRFTYVVQVFLLGALLATALAVGRYYTRGVFGFSHPIACAAWGILFGFPSAALFVSKMNPSKKD